MAEAADSNTASSTDVIDVAVVGGGPAGLFAAFALHKYLPGSRIKLYEKAAEYRECGAGIFLDFNGMRSLQAVDEELFQTFQNAVTAINLRSRSGDRLEQRTSQTLPQSWSKELHLKAGLIGWFELLMLMRKAIPDGLVEMGYSLKDIQVADGGESASLHFTNGKTVQAGVIVGADGYFSSVRQAVVQDGPPEFADVVMWRARVNWRDDLGLPEDVPGTSSVKAIDRAVAMLYSLPGNKVVWTFTYKVDKVREAGVEYDPEQYASSRAAASAASVQHHRSADSSAFERCRQVVRESMPDLEHIVADTEASAVVEHGLYTRPAEQVEALADKGWGKSVVTLLGDAAHAMRPTGQGLNTSLEDAVVLAWHLQRTGLTAEALRAYERERIPRIGVIAKQEWARAASSYGTPIEVPMPAEEYERFKNFWQPPSFQEA